MKTLRPLLALLTILGCSDDAAGPLTPAQLCAAYSNANVIHDGHPPDEELEQLAHVLPGGFGGMIPTYFYLKDPTKADAVRATAATLADCDGMNNQLLPFFATASVRQGKYDWIELRGWYRALQQQGGWQSSGMDESNNRLEFEFTTQAALDQFRTMARSRGVPDDALSLTIGEPVTYDRR